MEPNGQQTPGQAPSASAKRRRRRRRAAASAAEAAAQNQSGQARPAPAGPKQNAPRQGAQNSQGGQSGQSRGERRGAAGGTPPRGQKNPPRPGRERADQGSPRRVEKAAAPRVLDDDPGLLLTPRTPPAHTCASFAASLTPRGGPGAPSEGDEE